MKKAGRSPEHSDFESNPFKVIFQGFNHLFQYNRNPAILLLILGLLGAVNQLASFAPDMSGEDNQASAPDLDGAKITAIVLAVVLVLLIGLVLTIFINGTVSFIAWKTSRQETTTIKQAIMAVKEKFWLIAGVYARSFLRIMGGFLLLIIPGIRASLRYQMVLFPVFEENLRGKAALERIKAITKDHLVEIFGMDVAAGIIVPLELPLRTGGEAVMYRQLKVRYDTGAPNAKVHWLNYLAFIVLAVITVLLVGVAALVMIAS